MTETKLEKLLHMYCMNDGAGLMTDEGEKQQEELKADLEKAIKFHDDCDSSLNSTLGVIKELQKENASLKEKSRLYDECKAHHHDSHSCATLELQTIEYQNDLEMAVEAEANFVDILQKENRKLKIRIEADETIYQIQKKLLSNTRRSFGTVSALSEHYQFMSHHYSELLSKYLVEHALYEKENDIEKLKDRIEGLKELCDVYIGEKRDLSKMLDRLRELIHYKQGWLEINTYRITDYQKSLVEHEVRELEDIIGDKRYE